MVSVGPHLLKSDSFNTTKKGAIRLLIAPLLLPHSGSQLSGRSIRRKSLLCQLLARSFIPMVSGACNALCAHSFNDCSSLFTTSVTGLQATPALHLATPRTCLAVRCVYARNNKIKHVTPRVTAQNNTTGSHHGLTRKLRAAGIPGVTRCLRGMFSPAAVRLRKISRQSPLGFTPQTPVP